MIDSDAVHFRGRMTLERRARNLNEALGTLPAAASRGERLRFLASYGKAAGLSRPMLRELAAQVQE